MVLETMPAYKHCHDTVHWNMADITSRIVAESGIPSDRYHLGKIIMQGLKDSPDNVAQIEGTTGDSETNSSVLRRSIQCAIGLKKLGFQQGDVMILMAPNHLDLAVPFYAALYLGIIIAPLDRFLLINELVGTFTVTKPKIIFCQSEKVEDIRKALKDLELEAKVIAFDKSNGDIGFSELLEMGGDSKEFEEFCPVNFDPAESISVLLATSGTTGFPKAAAATHKNMAITTPYLWSRTVEIPHFQRVLVVSPLQWLTAIMMYITGPYMKLTRVQSQQIMAQEHAYELINKYKPSYVVMSPTMMASLMNPAVRDNCDFTCFEHITLGGSVVDSSLIEEVRKVTPRTEVCTGYAMSETTGMIFMHGFSSPPRSCGKPIGCLQYRLVDVDSGLDINEPNVNGELWVKGPGLFKGYYNNPEATRETFAEGGWLKTGDVFYRDDSWSFYFVERIKLLLKYKNHQISPAELEAVIRQHPGVLDVAVTGIPDPECGELPVACVVPAPNREPTAQQIKDLVKESLTDSKQLRGGVIFLKELPITASTKIHRRKIYEMALTMKRE